MAPTNSATSNARVCIVSLRGAQRQAAWCSNYEFEDVIAGVEEADVLNLMPGSSFGVRQWLARKLIWRPGAQRLVRHFNPGVEGVELTRDYELFVFVCMNPADLIFLSAVRDWRKRCRTAVCIMVEFYAAWADRYAFHLSLLNEFDHVGLCFGGSVEAVGRRVRPGCHHIPLGTDVLRFSPYPAVPERCIDCYSIGRRPESVHRALLGLAEQRGLYYVHDTIAGHFIQPRDHVEHRRMYASNAKRSRFFVAYPAKVDVTAETQGQSEVGARFYEGAAAGTVMIGQAPGAASFAGDFDWPDAVIDIGLTEQSVAEALSPLLNSPKRVAELGRLGAAAAARRYDWAYRWERVLQLANMEPTARLRARVGQLTDIAARLERPLSIR